MEYNYFNRDVSWLSFNYRVLLEAADHTVPLYERIKFLSIHASNLEEFYKVRVAEHRSVIMRKVHSEEDPAEAEQILNEIKQEVTRQQQEMSRIFRQEILPELKKQGVILYPNEQVHDFHKEWLINFFREEVFPFLQPVMLMPEDLKIFIRDNRLYLVVRLTKKGNPNRLFYYALIKLPYSKVSRFVELPRYKNVFYYMFVDDIIKANLGMIFPGFDVDCSYEIKISRDADIYMDEEQIPDEQKLVETIRKKVKKRKIGDLSRFVYDRNMPNDFLRFISEAFEIIPEDLIADNPHLSMEDLMKLPNPLGKTVEYQPFRPIRIPVLEHSYQLFPVIRKRDVFFHYPYHPFDYFIRFLAEASYNPNVAEIKITQYRVAENSAVINNLINAAQNGKKVVVFVELKARFDEENNMYTSELMRQAGIRIIYSKVGLKVHAKIALIKEKNTASGRQGKSYAYLSTGNFNEKTAKLYSDMAIMTSDKRITREIDRVFDVLEEKITHPRFLHLLVAKFNLMPQLQARIDKEIQHVQEGKIGHIILKMNGLQDSVMIDELYRASQAGVQIDLIVRGICCLVPEQEYSRNIRITRIVDRFLEHSRVWYFYNDGQEEVFLTSADWLKRNLYRRIETAFPIWDSTIKQSIIRILQLQLHDNVKACYIDEHLNNVFKNNVMQQPVWAQQDTYQLLQSENNN